MENKNCRLGNIFAKCPKTNKLIWAAYPIFGVQKQSEAVAYTYENFIKGLIPLTQYLSAQKNK